MSSTIWTQCAGTSEIGPLGHTAWRVVEAQHRVATRKVVDSLAAQQVLEDLLNSAKPPVGDCTLHDLLCTPFRYPPLRHGSRFGGRHERGVWYGAGALPTAFAEVAYYRLRFLEDSTADLGMVEVDLSAFEAEVETAYGVDLTAPVFGSFTDQLRAPDSYAATQPLGSAMRAAGVAAFLYASAREPEAGLCVAVFSPEALVPSARDPVPETWCCFAERAGVEFGRQARSRSSSYRFDREVFLVDEVLPIPG